jgi:hypothetical protein
MVSFVAGPGVFICNACVDLCKAILVAPASTADSGDSESGRLYAVGAEGTGGSRCSFCGKHACWVDALIAGPEVFICDECVELCDDTLAKSGESSGSDEQGRSANERRRAERRQREIDIVSFRLGHDDAKPRTIEEAADRFHIDAEQIRQMEARLLSKLRHLLPDEPSTYDDIAFASVEAVSRLLDAGVPDPPAVPLASDQLDIFGAVLFADFPRGSPPAARIELAVHRDDSWTLAGLGTHPAPELLTNRAPSPEGAGPFLIPYASGSHSRDERGPPEERWSVRYIAARATSEVASVTVTDRGVERELVPPSHGNLVILFRDADFPELAAFDGHGHQLLDSVHTQPDSTAE